MSKDPSQQRTLTVNIGGRDYNLRANGNEASYIRQLAGMVDERMSEVARTTGTVDSLRLAILTSLNLVDEINRQKSHFEARIREFELEKKKLLDMIEKTLET